MLNKKQQPSQLQEKWESCIKSKNNNIYYALEQIIADEIKSIEREDLNLPRSPHDEYALQCRDNIKQWAERLTSHPKFVVRPHPEFFEQRFGEGMKKFDELNNKINTIKKDNEFIKFVSMIFNDVDLESIYPTFLCDTARFEIKIGFLRPSSRFESNLVNTNIIFKLIVIENNLKFYQNFFDKIFKNEIDKLNLSKSIKDDLLCEQKSFLFKHIKLFNEYAYIICMIYKIWKIIDNKNKKELIDVINFLSKKVVLLFNL